MALEQPVPQVSSVDHAGGFGDQEPANVGCMPRSKWLSRHFWQIVFLMWACLLSGSCRSPAANPSPSIEFTKVPQADEGGPGQVERIEGRVTGANSGQQIVLFAKSGIWWVQPLVDEPFTKIQPDSTWKNTTHLGTEYAALLVKPGYRPPPTIDALPIQGGDVLAVANVKGTGSPPIISKTLNFSGYEWKIRTAASDRGGMTNAYDPANAWTDENGALHLRITRNSGPLQAQWACAEVQLTRSLGYGLYQFVVREASHLDPAAVLSMFTWDDLGADQNHREIDVEITRWGDPISKNAQYVVQPYYVPANVVRFIVPSGVFAHSFRWEPGQVAFRTDRGRTDRGRTESGRTVRGAVTNGKSGSVAEHVFTSGVPVPGGETVHLSFYVFGSKTNPLQREAEVVIEKFEYLP